MNKKIIILCLMLIIFSGTGLAENVKYFELKDNSELKLKFPGARIRIESWTKDYIKIDTTYLVKNDYTIDQKNEVLYFNKEKHLEKYPHDLDQSKWDLISNEVFFMITVPNKIKLSIEADSVNIKEGCKLKAIKAEFVRVRGSYFLDGFIGEGKKILMRENTYKDKNNVSLNYERVIKESYHGLFWGFKNILLK